MLYSPQQRIGFYNKAFPKYPSLHFDKGWIIGVWSIGNSYKNATSYYGCYPHSYLKRIGSMFPDAQRTLHLFSGSIPRGPYTTFDINPTLNPSVAGDAEKLSSYFEPGQFDLILADPPYSQDDADHYDCKMPNRFKVVKECYKVLEPGGILVWMDERLPMYRKVEFKRFGEIMITRSTNHRVRAVFLFEREPDV